MRAWPFLAVLIAGCGSGAQLCSPGATAPCLCGGSAAGVQTCNAEGAFLGCSCNLAGDGAPPSRPGVDARGAGAPRVGNGKLDLLFLVDNSGGTSEEQWALRHNFSVLLEPLRHVPARNLDLKAIGEKLAERL